MICDELETCLHEALIYQIAELFQRTSDRFSAQLIFSTHDTSLLEGSDLVHRAERREGHKPVLSDGDTECEKNRKPEKRVYPWKIWGDSHEK